MKFWMYKISFNAEDSKFEYAESIVDGNLNSYYNTADIGKNSYPLNKVLIVHKSLKEVIYVSDAQIIGDAKTFLINKYCDEIDETITFLSNVKSLMKGAV